tara:strand:- start:419 stop:964 length:546 start_codon:yes stop_codon:yes gene_type:complete
MALWGNNDNVLVANAGIITASGFNGAVTGSGTTFTNYSVGQTLTVGAGQTGGFGVITEITSDTAMVVTTSSMGEFVSPYVNSGVGTQTFIVGERPVSNIVDPEFAPSSSNAQRDYTSVVYGVNESIQSARDGSQFQPSHAGWVGVQTYMDTHGNLRVKTETLVAMSGITSNIQSSSMVIPS